MVIWDVHARGRIKLREKNSPKLFKGWINTIYGINLFPLDNSIAFESIYSVDSDLSVR